MSAEETIGNILKRGVTYYDFDSLKPELKKQYYAQAQSILRSDVWQNEFNHLMADWSKFAFQEAKTFEEVMGIRMSANALQMMQERLESISNPEMNVTTDSVHEPI